MSHGEFLKPPVTQSDQHGPQQRTIEHHRDAILASALEPTTETISVNVDAVNRVLSADQVAANAIPPFNNSAMDGFLVNRADLDSTGSGELTVTGDVAAGDAPLHPARGCATRIMTGAPVSDPVDGLLIVPVEYTNIAPGPQPLPDKVAVQGFDVGRLHIRFQGESLKSGQIFAQSGQVIDVGLLSTLISAGIEEVEVFVRPRVAVISTGNELAPVGQALSIGKIPDSNSPMVAALVRTCGQVDVTIAHSVDSPEGLRTLFDELAADHDVIVTTGGVAVGAFDVVREVLVNLAVHSWFGKVPHKPGSHQGQSVWQGPKSERVPVVSLPGNPVAAFVSFYLYVRPLLAQLSGSKNASGAPSVSAELVGQVPVARDKDVLVPAIIDFTAKPAQVTPFNGRKVGSHMIGALVGVNGLLHVRSEQPTSSEGDMVDVLLIPSTTW